MADTWVSGDGLEQRQSVPYALSYWYNGKPGETLPYRGQRIEPGEASPVPYTATSLDLLGRAVQVAAPDGTTTQTIYAILMDAGGPYQQTCTTDANSNTTCTRTDSRGRTVEVDPPEGLGVAYTYDAADRLKTANMGGAVTELWYDYAGRKTKMDDADMGFWQYGYNALGQLTKQEDARNCITNMNYDLTGRLSSKMYTLGNCGAAATSSVTNTYDGILHWQPFDSWPSTDWVKLGNVSVVNGELKLTGNGSWGTTYAYHSTNLIDGQAVRFSFKADDVYIESYITLDRGVSSDTSYRGWTLRLEGGYLKREYKQGTSTAEKMTLMALKANTWYEGVLAIDGSDPNTASSSYPPRFRVVVWERDNPNVWAQNWQSFAADWSYSDWKFVTQVKTNGKILTLDNVQEYDDGAIGQRSRMNDGSGSTEWIYTSRGQVQSEKKTIGSGEFLTQYGYHPDGSVRWMQYPDDEKLTYFYHAQKAPSSLQTSLEGGLYYLSSVSYGDVYYNNTSERYILHKLGNDGLQLKQTFFAWSTPNGNGRLKQITAGTTGTPTSLLDLRYYTGTNTPAYDEVGNILNIYDYKTASPQTQTFTYDDLYRLLTASATGGTDGTYSESYTYDPNTGNLASKTGMGNYTYGSSNHAHAVTATGNGNSYNYDPNGNQITRVIGSITYTLSYDAENRLVSVSWAVLNVSHSMTFVFDGDGSRVKSTLDGTTTTFAGTHYEVTGSAITKYYYSGTSRIAMRSSSGVRYIFGDHLGSASVTADRNGSSVTRQLYKPYGETRSSGSVPTKYQFTGQYAYNGSTEIGLLYYVARFFDPQLGRFVSADMIVPQPGSPLDWDRYLFVRGNPLLFTDPSGNNPECGPDGVFCDHDEWNDYDYLPDLTEAGKIIIEIARKFEELSGSSITLREITRLIFEREFNGYGSLGLPEKVSAIAGVFTEAAARNYWRWSEYVYGTHTKTTLLNWLGAHNSVAKDCLDYIQNNESTALLFYFGETRPFNGNSQVANKIASGLLYTPNEWKIINDNAPYTWAHCTDSECFIDGNKREAFKNIDNTTWKNGVYLYATDMTKMYFKWGYSYIITRNQLTYWNSP